MNTWQRKQRQKKEQDLRMLRSTWQDTMWKIKILNLEIPPLKGKGETSTTTNHQFLGSRSIFQAVFS